MWTLWLLLAAAAVGLAESAEGSVRGCYYTNWSHYRNGRGKYWPEDYIPGLCTHIFFAFGTFGNDFIAREFDPADITSDWMEGMYPRINRLKQTDPGLKTLLSFGGWNFGTVLFKAMARNEENRRTFIDSVIVFARKHGFDGVDLDWEYPNTEQDKANFNKLLEESLAAFEAEAAASGSERLLLTAAVSVGSGTVSAGYDIPTVAKYLDLILLMSYDFHGAWEYSSTGHNAPLFGREGEIEWQKKFNIAGGASVWVDGGMPKEKIVIGLATYARGWTLVNPAEDYGMGARARGASKVGKFTGESGILAYYEVCEMIADGAKRYWHEEHEVPWIVYGDQWVGYDDVESITNKANWVKREGFAGAFVWTLDFDDFNAQCSNSDGERYPLIRAMQRALEGDGSVTPPPTPATTTAEPEPETTTAQPQVTASVKIEPGEVVTITIPWVTTTVAPDVCLNEADGFAPDPNTCEKFIICQSGRYKGTLSCPHGLNFDVSIGYCIKGEVAGCEDKTTTTTTTTVAPKEATTVKPAATTTEGPFVCPADGFQPHPSNCNLFYRCVSGTAYAFNCPGNTHFDTVSVQCVYPEVSTCVAGDATAFDAPPFIYNDAIWAELDLPTFETFGDDPGMLDPDDFTGYRSIH